MKLEKKNLNIDWIKLTVQRGSVDKSAMQFFEYIKIDIFSQFFPIFTKFSSIYLRIENFNLFNFLLCKIIR